MYVYSVSQNAELESTIKHPGVWWLLVLSNECNKHILRACFMPMPCQALR